MVSSTVSSLGVEAEVAEASTRINMKTTIRVKKVDEASLSAIKSKGPRSQTPQLSIRCPHQDKTKKPHSDCDCVFTQATSRPLVKRGFPTPKERLEKRRKPDLARDFIWRSRAMAYKLETTALSSESPV